MTPRDAARRWADVWKVAWEQLDAEAIVALYDADALLSTAPFRDPYVGQQGVREYVTRVFAEEEDPHVVIGAPLVDGDRSAVSWWTTLQEEDTDTTLAGTSLLRFSADGLVVEQWDTWHTVSERREPPPDWGPFRWVPGGP